MTSNHKTVLITGATRGIGAAIAAAFAREGAEVIGTGTNPKSIAAAEAVAPSGIRFLDLDLDDTESTTRFLTEVEALPRLDILVNNAGVNIIRPIDEVTDEDLDRLSRINYRGPYLLCRAAARVMKRGHDGGRIINVGSIWSINAKPDRTLYCAAKSGLAGLSRALAVELAPYRILVNCLSPGFVLTDLTRASLTPRQQEELIAQLPLGRFADPEEIARVAVFLAGPGATYLTGQNLVVDGGFTLV